MSEEMHNKCCPEVTTVPVLPSQNLLQRCRAPRLSHLRSLGRQLAARRWLKRLPVEIHSPLRVLKAGHVSRSKLQVRMQQIHARRRAAEDPDLYQSFSPPDVTQKSLRTLTKQFASKMSVHDCVRMSAEIGSSGRFSATWKLVVES